MIDTDFLVRCLIPRIGAIRLFADRLTFCDIETGPVSVMSDCKNELTIQIKTDIDRDGTVFPVKIVTFKWGGELTLHIWQLHDGPLYDCVLSAWTGIHRDAPKANGLATTDEDKGSTIENMFWDEWTKTVPNHNRLVQEHEVKSSGKLYRIDYAWPGDLIGIELDGYD